MTARRDDNGGAAAAGFAVRGWCPGALRPMASGDGLLVRLRPPGGRLGAAQARAIAAAAQSHGNGLIELSARANLQLRGVAPDRHAGLIARLRGLGLVDADTAAEARRNLLVTPFADAETDALAQRLTQALAAEDPGLPAKFGFALDCGPAPLMQASAADIRLERAATGGLILRCDGLALGAPVTAAEAPGAALALARWFVQAGGIGPDGRGRMAALVARGARPRAAMLAPRLPPAPAAPLPQPGLHPAGRLVAAEFGLLHAGALAALADLGDLRLTPWRMLLLDHRGAPPGIASPDLSAWPGLILQPGDARLRVSACPGAPACPQGHAAVRPLARQLAGQVPEGRHLHLSGCAKGCAHPGPADLTLVAGPGGFDLIRAGNARATPAATGLPTPDPAALKGWFDNDAQL